MKDYSNTINALNSANPEHCGACFLYPYCDGQSGCMAHDAADAIEELDKTCQQVKNALQTAGFEDFGALLTAYQQVKAELDAAKKLLEEKGSEV